MDIKSALYLFRYLHFTVIFPPYYIDFLEEKSLAMTLQGLTGLDLNSHLKNASQAQVLGAYNPNKQVPKNLKYQLSV